MPVGVFWSCAFCLLAGVALEQVHRVDGHCVSADAAVVVVIFHSNHVLVHGRSNTLSSLVGITVMSAAESLGLERAMPARTAVRGMCSSDATRGIHNSDGRDSYKRIERSRSHPSKGAKCASHPPEGSKARIIGTGEAGRLTFTCSMAATPPAQTECPCALLAFWIRSCPTGHASGNPTAAPRPELLWLFSSSDLQHFGEFSDTCHHLHIDVARTRGQLVFD